MDSSSLLEAVLVRDVSNLKSWQMYDALAGEFSAYVPTDALVRAGQTATLGNNVSLLKTVKDCSSQHA